MAKWIETTEDVILLVLAVMTLVGCLLFLHGCQHFALIEYHVHQAPQANVVEVDGQAADGIAVAMPEPPPKEASP